MVSIKDIFRRNKSKSDISNKEIENWLKDGLQKGYGFNSLRDILINNGLKEEADRLTYLFSKAIKSEEEKKHFRRISTLEIIGVIILLVFALISALFFILNNGTFPWGGYFVSESKDIGAVVNVNFASEIGEVREDFYGVNTHGIWGSNLSFVGTYNNATLNKYSDYQWHRDALLNARIKEIRADMYLENLAKSDGSFDETPTSNADNINIQKGLVAYAKSNDIKILFIASFMPEWLADKTRNLCTSSNLWMSCPPSNYTKWGNLIVNYLNAVGCDSNTCEVEVWNEPDLQVFWLDNLSLDYSNWFVRSIEYNKLYNATYLAVKANYPNMPVGGPATIYSNEQGLILMNGLMSNFSEQIDFISFHEYRISSYENTLDNLLQDDYDRIILGCSTYNINCSRIIFSEWGDEDNNLKNTSLMVNEYAMNYGVGYIGSLNKAPLNITMIIYQWSRERNYISGNKWEIVSEPQLDNAYYPPYNVTKNFATYHSAGSTVVKSNSSSSNIKVVASKKGGSQYITVINTGKEINVGLNIFGEEISQIKDLESNVIYNITDGGASIGLISQYQIRYFVSLNDLVSPKEKPKNNPIEKINNNIQESEEQCGDINSSNQTCESLGYASGTLSYGSGCILNTSGCIANSSDKEKNVNKGSSRGNSGITSATPSISSSKDIGEVSTGASVILKNFDIETGVKEIQIEVKNNAQDSKVTVSKYDDRPTDVSKAKDGKIYKYLRIETENLENNIENASLIFQVEKSWAEINNIDKNNVAIFKFFPNEDRWAELNSSYTDSDEDYYYYKTELTGFSYFVIGEKEQLTEQNEINSTPKNILFLGFIGIIILAIIVLIVLIIKRVRVISLSKRIMERRY